MLGPLLRNLRRQGSCEIDGATLLGPVTTDLDAGEAEIVESINRDDVFLQEMQNTVASLNLGEDEDTAQADR